MMTPMQISAEAMEYQRRVSMMLAGVLYPRESRAERCAMLPQSASMSPYGFGDLAAVS